MASQYSSNIIPAAGFSSLGLVFIPVPPALSPWVQSICATKGNGASGSYVEENLYPDAGSSITFAITASSAESYYLLQDGVCRIKWSVRARYITVRFQPGAAFSLLGLPLEVNDNMTVDTCELHHSDKTDTGALNDQLPGLKMDEQVTLILHWLIQQANQTTIPDEKWRRFFDIATLPASSPEQWASVYGMSRRTLERHCKNRAGFSPHQLLSFARFQKVRNALINTALPLTDIALINGFYDQSHLTNAFREFASETPYQYRKRKLSQISNSSAI